MPKQSTEQPNMGSNYIGQDKQFPTNDDKQLAVVLNAYNYSRSFYSYRYLKFRQWLRLFHRIPDTKPPFRSNLFIPLVYPLVSTVLPRMVANNPSFRFEPREESDEEAVEQMSTLIKYQLDRADFFKKLKMWVKDCLMFGVGIMKVYWYRNDKEGVNDTDLQVVDLFDFFPDPKATQVDSGDFMIHRTIVPLSGLRKAVSADGKKIYKNLDQIKDNSNEENSNKLYLTNDRAMTIGDIDARLILGTPYRQSLTRQVEILEYWGIFGNDDEEYLITIANRNTVIRFEKNPYDGLRPFVKMEIDPVNFLFYGTGLIDPLENLQNALNDTRNQRMDNVNLILNKIFLVLKDADVNEQELISRPGGVIYQSIPGGVSILETPDITQSAYQEEALIKQDAQEAIGVTDIIQGALTDANAPVKGQVTNKTARGAQIAVEQAGSRFKYYMQNMEDSLKKLGELMYKYNQLFLSEEKVIRVEAPNDYEALQKSSLLSKIKQKMGMPSQPQSQFVWKKIRPDSIKNLNLDVRVESGSTQPIEESLKQQKILNLIGLFAQLPVTTPKTYLSLAEMILDAYNTPKKDKILQTLEIPQQQAPKASVSVSLKGDLNPLETADIAKQVGASQQSTDPKLITGLMAQERHDGIMDKMVDHASALDQKLFDHAAGLQQSNAQPGGQANIPGSTPQ